MLLLTSDEIAALRSDLEGQDGFRIASIDVDFDAFDFARTGESLVDRAVAYSMPNGDRLVGIGTAWSASATGDSRFDEVRERLADLDRPQLKAFVGFSFLDEPSTSPVWDGYPPAEVFLPRIGIEQSGDHTRLTVIVPEGDEPTATLELLGSISHPEPISVMDVGDHTIESHPSASEWAETVADAVDAIRRGDLEKVVLARSVVVESTQSVAILRVFRELVEDYPQCYSFAWKSGDSVFMGASPELFAEIQGTQFRSNPLAGSAPRGEGEEEDREIAQRLLTLSKELEEHALVVDDLAKRLSPLVSNLEVPVSPALKQMATVQHLSTEIDGTIESGVGILDIVAATHPTPAVGGVGREAAIRYITEVEGMDRGWYSGGIGWITGSGEGSICIALRCGLVRDNITHVFAGAGIVADSDPRSEVAETRLKLRPLMDILTAN